MTNEELVQQEQRVKKARTLMVQCYSLRERISNIRGARSFYINGETIGYSPQFGDPGNWYPIDQVSCESRRSLFQTIKDTIIESLQKELSRMTKDIEDL